MNVLPDCHEILTWIFICSGDEFNILAIPDLSCSATITPKNVHHFSIIFFSVCLVLLKVYCSDHTYTTIRVAVAATGREVISAVADKLGTADELVLVHLSSAGGKNIESV